MVPTLADATFFDSLDHGTTGFMYMGTIMELTKMHQFTHLRKTFCHFCLFEINKSTLFDAGGIDDIPAKFQWKHLCKSCRVFSFLMGFRNESCPQTKLRLNLVDQSRFPNSRMTRKESYLIFHVFLQFIQTITGQGRNFITIIPDLTVEITHRIMKRLQLFGIDICFIKNQGYRYVVCRSEERR